MGVAARIVIVLAFLPFLILAAAYAAMRPVAPMAELLAALFVTNIVIPLAICFVTGSWVARRVACLTPIILLAIALPTLNAAPIVVYLALFVWAGGLLSLPVVRRAVDDDVTFVWGGARSFYSRHIFARNPIAGASDD